jgi:hypothetical protein
MPAIKSAADQMLKRVLEEAFVAVLKPLTFKKTSHTFYRRHNKVVQVVNVQLSQGSSHAEKRFYVNVGLAFDEVCRLAGREIVETPKEHQCTSRGRLEEFVRGVPDSWEVSNPSKLDATIARLRQTIERLADGLKEIGSVSEYRNHAWFRRHSVPSAEVAQIHYVDGDLDGAGDEVKAMCAEFADRDTINKPEYWIEELKLSKLRDRARDRKK